MRFVIPALLLLVSTSTNAQKKPLDHTVYDSWESIGERAISNDGKWVVYSVNVQEGDNELVVRNIETNYEKRFPRGYNATITNDNKYVIFRIRPTYKQTRDARIAKKRTEDMPKDSLAIVELGQDQVTKFPRIKSYKTPELGSVWLAYHHEKKSENIPRGSTAADRKIIDSLRRTIDSLKLLTQKKRKDRKDETEEVDEVSMFDIEGDDVLPGSQGEGSDLVVRNLLTGVEKKFELVTDYLFDKKGKKLLIEVSRNTRDSLSLAALLIVQPDRMVIDTISRGGNDFRNFTWSEDGTQLAFVAERTAKPKDLQKLYKLYYHTEGMDTASVLVEKNSVGMKVGMTISEHGNLRFSKSGKRVLFGSSPIPPLKDTSLVDIDLVKVDVWHYNDDYLQTTQLSRLQRDLQENFLTIYDLDLGFIKQVATREIPTVYTTDEGDGDVFVGVSDFGKRLESQWTGSTKKDIYAINIANGKTELIAKNLHGVINSNYVSPGGKYIVWYDRKQRHYFAWDGSTVRNITKEIRVPLWNEDFDTPDDPTPYGLMSWKEGDDALFVYDKYSVWKIDPTGIADPVLFLDGRSNKRIYRYLQTDPEEQAIKPGQILVFRTFNDVTKDAGLLEWHWTSSQFNPRWIVPESRVSIGQVRKAKEAATYIFTKENYQNSPDLFAGKVEEILSGASGSESFNVSNIKLSSINSQQKNFNWGTAELFKWKAYNGKEVEGIVYKPEDFDPRKNYPLISYFYETHSDNLNQYVAPSPTPSRLNISFFVSRGYVVFSPDIHYTIGQPARDAYNHVVSGIRALVKRGYIDSTRIGIQGQSWGGIQVAQLITMTKLFKAAWAGAPVANMTSAYGGIRWETGLSRQFQYEKTQSRIGATLWEKPNLYIENSPLFHLPKVTTPLVIMANDADGAVPWYQGIELFTAMKRLGKKVWLLNYNGEAHNLVERKNRKDIQVRQQQFFDWLLKDEPPARWITDGVPATRKGADWGLDIIDEED